jgi:hypothetical protein
MTRNRVLKLFSDSEKIQFQQLQLCCFVILLIFAFEENTFCLTAWDNKKLCNNLGRFYFFCRNASFWAIRIQSRICIKWDTDPQPWLFDALIFSLQRGRTLTLGTAARKTWTRWKKTSSSPWNFRAEKVPVTSPPPLTRAFVGLLFFICAALLGPDQVRSFFSSFKP